MFSSILSIDLSIVLIYRSIYLHIGSVPDMMTRHRYERSSPGFFGRLELARPIYHPYFIGWVLSVLKCVSYYSSQLLVEKDSRAFAWCMEAQKPEERLRRLVTTCGSVSSCPATNHEQPKYRVDTKQVSSSYYKSSPLYIYYQISASTHTQIDT